MEGNGTCAGDDILAVRFPKALAIGARKRLITQNIDLHTRLWSVLRGKEGKAKLLTIGIDDQSLTATERCNCPIVYIFVGESRAVDLLPTEEEELNNQNLDLPGFETDR